MATMLARIAEAARALQVPEAGLTALAATYAEAKTWGTPEERRQAAMDVLWVFRDPRAWEPGGFTQTLLLAWRRADPANRARLCLGFPLYGVAFDIQASEGIDGLARWGGL